MSTGARIGAFAMGMMRLPSAWIWRQSIVAVARKFAMPLIAWASGRVYEPLRNNTRKNTNETAIIPTSINIPLS